MTSEERYRRREVARSHLEWMEKCERKAQKLERAAEEKEQSAQMLEELAVTREQEAQSLRLRVREDRTKAREMERKARLSRTRSLQNERQVLERLRWGLAFREERLRLEREEGPKAEA